MMENARVQNGYHVERRLAIEAAALALVNGLLLGAGFTAAHRGPALLLASGAGTLLTLTYLLTMRWIRC